MTHREKNKASRGELRTAFLLSLGGNGLCLGVVYGSWPHSFVPLLVSDALTVGGLGYYWWTRRHRGAAGVGLGYLAVFLFALLTL